MAQKAGGVGIYTCDDGTFEVATFTCKHCSKIVDVPNQRRLTDVGDVCRLCNGLICAACAGKPCTPWMKRIEQIEESAYRRAQMRKMMGL